ncbi:MAG: MarR family winged helix-turn-helix transcriptional regulator, partial [Actinomycetota bacterium]
MPGPSEELLEAMTTVSRYFFRIMTRCLADLPEAEDVSATQYRTLAILALRGPRNASVLADELGVGRPAATKLVDRLVRRRLIRRGRHQTDRRQVILEATERGRGIVRAVQQ